MSKGNGHEEADPSSSSRAESSRWRWSRRANRPSRKGSATDRPGGQLEETVESRGNGDRQADSGQRDEKARYSDWLVLRRVVRESRGYRRQIIGVLLISLVATPLALLGPVPLALAVDSVLGSEPVPSFLDRLLPSWFDASAMRLLLFAAALQVAVVVLNHVQYIAQYMLETYTGEKLTLRFRARLLGHAQRLSFSFHDARGTADSIYRIQSDASAIQYIAVYGFIPFISAAVTLVSMIYIVVRIDFQLALVALAISPFLFLSSHLLKIKMRPEYTRTKQLESSALKVVQEVLSSIRVVKAFGREEGEEERFREVSSQGVRARVRLALAESLFSMLVNVITAVGTAIVLFIGIRNVQAGVLTTGQLLLVLAYLSQLYGPLKTISRKLASLQGYLASAQRAFELLDEVPDVMDRPNAQPLARAAGHVELRKVSFSYDGKARVLEDLTFDVPAGTRLGIYGRTGAGKTTLVSLLTRFYDPTEGVISLDGTDLREYRLADLRRQFAIVLQEPLLFSTTIADNIAYARPDASRREIVDAAHAADAHRFVTELSTGYDTIVGERGMRLSGGERQRISLARAFLRDAPILILDEPTSSVDLKTEASIMDAMHRLMEGRTTFMIAHRLSTLDHCDLLLEIRGGRAIVRPADHLTSSRLEAKGPAATRDR